MKSKENPNPSCNLEKDKMETVVLCIFTYRCVFIMDIAVIDVNSRFLESRLPLGMGLLKSGNFLYMFGGEYCDFYESDYRLLMCEEEMSPSARECDTIPHRFHTRV